MHRVHVLIRKDLTDARRSVSLFAPSRLFHTKQSDTIAFNRQDRFVHSNVPASGTLVNY